MVSVLLSGVDDALIGSFATPGLIDSPTLESDAAEDRRAMLMGDGDFDPAGLYAQEVERDAASTILADAFPGLTVSLHHSTTHIRIDDKWQSSGEWSALVQSPTGSYHAIAANPTDAVKAVIKAHRKATARVRQTPEHRPLVSHSFESFGIINPATATAFLDLVEQHIGSNDFLVIEPDGRVMLATGSVECSESHAIGDILALHNLTNETRAAEDAIRILIEPRGASFKAILIIPSGERVEVAGVTPTEPAAREWARQAIIARRPTVPNSNSSIDLIESNAA